MKTEAKFKARTKQVAAIELPGFVIFYVAGVGTDGIPDWSNNGYGVSSWLEFKDASPHGRFESKENQERVCLKLSAASRCRYVVFHETTKGVKRICIIDPRQVQGKRGELSEMMIEAQCSGYDYKWLCNWIKEWHR